VPESQSTLDFKTPRGVSADLPLRTIIVNCKNYPEVLGEGSVRMARAVVSASRSLAVEGIVAPPHPMLSLVAESGAVVYSQSVGSESGDKTTGAVLPESVKAAGASGTILNHSESRVPMRILQTLMPRLSDLRLAACLCSRTSSEAVKVARLRPKYVAIEPPELIGTGVAVSRAKPGLIRDTVSALRESGYRGKILCGAGITNREDVSRAVDLGADGILVASSVVKAKDWEAKIRELAGSLS
jgi:triosephosphate isomerase (TIM)